MIHSATTFNVSGPTGVQVSSATPLPTQVIGNALLELGNNPAGTNGITFNETATSTASGVYEWSQIIKNTTLTEKYGSVTEVCMVGPNVLDSYDPTRTGAEVGDSPDAPLVSPYTNVAIASTFRMYFMWNSGVGTSPISITLGYIDWGWNGDAVLTSGVWSVNPSQSSTKVGGFQVDTGLPTWTQYFKSGVTGGTCT